MKKRKKASSRFVRDNKLLLVVFVFVILFFLVILNINIISSSNPYVSGSIGCCEKVCTLQTFEKPAETGLSNLGSWNFFSWIFRAGAVSSNAQNKNVVLYDFYATWCGPCMGMNPVIKALIAAGYNVQKVNVDPSGTGKIDPAIAKKYGIGKIPTFVTFVNGKGFEQITGGTSYSALENMIKKAIANSQLPSLPIPRPEPPVQPPVTPTPNPNLVPVKIPLTDKEICKNNNKQCGKWEQDCGEGKKRIVDCNNAIGCKQCQSCDWKSGKCVPDTSLIEQNFPSSNTNNNNNANTNNQNQQNNPITNNQNQINPNNLENDLKSSNVRIKIYDTNQQGSGSDTGSGTIIDSRNGWALILTCAHIFRQHTSTGPIVIDLVGNNKVNIQDGYAVSISDYDRDVALIAIPTAQLSDFKVAPLAPKGSVVQPGEKVYYTGCDKGGACVFGDTNIGSNSGNQIWINAAGVGGRSGGGLFDKNGNVIGVDNGVSGGQSLYAGLPYIYEMLDKNNLGFVYQDKQAQLQPVNPNPQIGNRPSANCKKSETSIINDGCCVKGGTCGNCPGAIPQPIPQPTPQPSPPPTPGSDNDGWGPATSSTSQWRNSLAAFLGNLYSRV